MRHLTHLVLILLPLLASCAAVQFPRPRAVHTETVAFTDLGPAPAAGESPPERFTPPLGIQLMLAPEIQCRETDGRLICEGVPQEPSRRTRQCYHLQHTLPWNPDMPAMMDGLYRRELGILEAARGPGADPGELRARAFRRAVREEVDTRPPDDVPTLYSGRLGDLEVRLSRYHTELLPPLFVRSRGAVEVGIYLAEPGALLAESTPEMIRVLARIEDLDWDGVVRLMTRIVERTRIDPEPRLEHMIALVNLAVARFLAGDREIAKLRRLLAPVYALEARSTAARLAERQEAGFAMLAVYNLVAGIDALLSPRVEVEPDPCSLLHFQGLRPAEPPPAEAEAPAPDGLPTGDE